MNNEINLSVWVSYNVCSWRSEQFQVVISDAHLAQGNWGLRLDYNSIVSLSLVILTHSNYVTPEIIDKSLTGWFDKKKIAPTFPVGETSDLPTRHTLVTSHTSHVTHHTCPTRHTTHDIYVTHHTQVMSHITHVSHVKQGQLNRPHQASPSVGAHCCAACPLNVGWLYLCPHIRYFQTWNAEHTDSQLDHRVENPRICPVKFYFIEIRDSNQPNGCFSSRWTLLGYCLF